MVGGFHGVLLLSAKHSRSLFWWEDTNERRFGMPFNGPVIPFGAMVEYQLISAKDLSRLHHFGPRILPCICLGYALYTWWVWKGDIHARRINAKAVLTPMKGDKFKFPVADGTVKTPGGDRRLRPYTLIRDRSEREEEQEVFRRESDGLSSPTPIQDDSTREDAEAKNDFWSFTGDFICRHHVEPKVQLYMPKFPFPMKYIDVTRSTHTSLDVMSEKQIYDYWKVDGERELSDAWTGFTRFIYWTKGHLKDIHGPVGDWRGTNNLKTRQMYGRTCGSICLMQRKAKAKQQWYIEKPKLDHARSLRGIYFIDPKDE